MKIYVTYCSGQKNDKLKETGLEVLPDELYTSKRIQAFMRACKHMGVRWAIFSDHYGVWFHDEKHGWYDKPPETVTEAEFKELLRNFDDRLAEYDEIYFYRPSPRYFHSIYRRLLKESSLRERIQLIGSINYVKP
jgi:hypothetical protein